MATNTIDTSNAVSIRSTRAGGARLFCGLPVGPVGSQTNAITYAVVAGTETHAARAIDFHEATGLGPVARGEKLREISGPLLELLQRSGLTLAAARASLEARVKAASAFDAWGPSTPFYTVQIGLKLVDKFNMLRPIEQSARVAMSVTNPRAHVAMTAALLAVPGELTNLTEVQLDSMRVAALRAIKPTEFATLDLELDMLNLAETTVVQACRSVADGSNTYLDLDERAPAAVVIRTLKPLVWVPGADVDDGLWVTMPKVA
ncbi:MAG: hypothetical protein Q8R33_18600 [Burkholderiales bacterium]|nr:hypothetical protein [Burkholderiales bacterium]